MIGMMADDQDKPAKSPRDVVMLHGPTEDGEGVRALRARDDRIEVAELRRVKEGKPLTTGELVRLHPRVEAPFLCDVEVLLEKDRTSDVPGHKGPPRVSSRTYRRNWESVFSGAHPKDPNDPKAPKRSLN
jgi:hypothetical protein